MPARKAIRISKRRVVSLWTSGLRSVRGIARKLDANTMDGKKIIRTILEEREFVRHHFDTHEIGAIRKLYPHVDAEIVARKLGRPLPSIYGKAAELGVHKSAQWLRKKRMQWAKVLTEKGKPYRFHEDQVSWNSGMKGLKFPGSEKGQFKKGHRSKRWKGYHNGSIRIRQDKTGRFYKYIRLAPGKWEFLHRHLWQKAHGRIPKGKLIVFRDRNSLNCRLSNLMMIDRKTHGARWALTDGGIAKAMACMKGGKGHINPRLFNELLNQPILLEAKRRQLELQRNINGKQ